jgi:Flp pilus assembly protein TadD
MNQVRVRGVVASDSLRWATVLIMLIMSTITGCAVKHPAPVDRLSAREHVTLGEIYAAQGHPDLATQEFRAALAQQADLPAALVGLGNVAFQAGEMHTAEQHYRRALHAAPHHPGAANSLAMIYVLSGDRLDEAERLARGALERSGVLRPYILETLATVYIRQGRYRDAAFAVDEAERLAAPDSPVLRERLTQLRRELVGLVPSRDTEAQI